MPTVSTRTVTTCNTTNDVYTNRVKNTIKKDPYIKEDQRWKGTNKNNTIKKL